LLHGDDDTVIPAAESALLNDYLRSKGANVHLLLSNLITHAEVNREATASDAWKLISFWASLLETIADRTVIRLQKILSQAGVASRRAA
jgi:hypothetical protein